MTMTSLLANICYIHKKPKPPNKKRNNQFLSHLWNDEVTLMDMKINVDSLCDFSTEIKEKGQKENTQLLISFN